ncbi:MAG: hypothetical protein ACR2RL_21815 [Gammaproteobacteria bacterium]
MAIDWLAYAALAASAAGTGASVYAQNQASERQSEAALAALRNQQARQDEISRGVEAQVRELGPDARQQRQDTAADSITDRLNAVIGQARDAGPAAITPGVEGRVSSDALTQTAAATERQATSAAELARLLGQTQAPLRGRQQEAQGFADLASRTGTLQNFAGREAGVDRNAIAQAGQVNPYVAGAGAVATGAGNAYLANPGAFDFLNEPRAQDFQGVTLGQRGTNGRDFYDGSGYIIDLPR